MADSLNLDELMCKWTSDFDEDFDKQKPSIVKITDKKRSRSNHRNESQFSSPRPKNYRKRSVTSSLGSNIVPTIRDLCDSDKARIAQLIKELAKVTAQKDEVLSKLSSEKAVFEDKLTNLSSEKNSLMDDRKKLQEKLSEAEIALTAVQKQLTEQITFFSRQPRHDTCPCLTTESPNVSKPRSFTEQIDLALRKAQSMEPTREKSSNEMCSHICNVDRLPKCQETLNQSGIATRFRECPNIRCAAAIHEQIRCKVDGHKCNGSTSITSNAGCHDMDNIDVFNIEKHCANSLNYLMPPQNQQSCGDIRKDDHCMSKCKMSNSCQYRDVSRDLCNDVEHVQMTARESAKCKSCPNETSTPARVSLNKRGSNHVNKTNRVEGNVSPISCKSVASEATTNSELKSRKRTPSRNSDLEQRIAEIDARHTLSHRELLMKEREVLERERRCLELLLEQRDANNAHQSFSAPNTHRSRIVRPQSAHSLHSVVIRPGLLNRCDSRASTHTPSSLCESVNIQLPETEEEATASPNNFVRCDRYSRRPGRSPPSPPSSILDIVESMNGGDIDSDIEDDDENRLLEDVFFVKLL